MILKTQLNIIRIQKKKKDKRKFVELNRKDFANSTRKQYVKFLNKLAKRLLNSTKKERRSKKRLLMLQENYQNGTRKSRMKPLD